MKQKKSYTLTLKPVYSCPASEVPANIELPTGWNLAWHQAETIKALRDPNIDIVFNTAMTGDGKSLAAYLESLQNDFFAIGLYPTNELARDQESQLQKYVDTFQPKPTPRINRLSSAELEIYAETEGLKKSAAIASRTGNSEILVTNPDIFHYIYRGAYVFGKDSPDKLWHKLDRNFDCFIFDEFHVFQAHQIASVINTLLLIRYTSGLKRCSGVNKKFLFLSATPSESLIAKLETAGFRYRIIDPTAENKYRFPDSPEEAQTLEVQGWRQVSRPINLNFIPLEPASRSSEDWLKDNGEDILNFFREHPGSKGAIILNSIAAVKRLTPWFRELFEAHGLTVRENTGLSGKQEKELSLSADLVLGTSTIDVGVDFKINLLVFESADAGNFIQRLGRLGRHDGYDKDGEEIPFDVFVAYALVPNFFAERLFEVETPPLQDEGVCDRPSFHNIVRESYRKINDFQGYYCRWGAVQSFRLCYSLNHKTIREQYGESARAFGTACEKVFETNLKKIAGRTKGWAQEWEQLSGKKGNPIAEDAASFRGSSPLQCGLYDLTEENPSDRFKTYDLPGVLSNLEIEMWTEKAFMDSLRSTAEQSEQPIPKGRYKHCLGFMKLRGYREERLNWKFTYDGDLRELVAAWKVQVLYGIGIWQPDNPWAREINKRLQSKALVCYLLPHPVREVKLRLQLPLHFGIYGICDRFSSHDANPPYSIAFGQSALAIDTLAYRFQRDGGKILIV